jgi:hypothetical protein
VGGNCVDAPAAVGVMVILSKSADTKFSALMYEVDLPFGDKAVVMQWSMMDCPSVTTLPSAFSAGLPCESRAGLSKIFLTHCSSNLALVFKRENHNSAAELQMMLKRK